MMCELLPQPLLSPPTNTQSSWCQRYMVIILEKQKDTMNSTLAHVKTDVYEINNYSTVKVLGPFHSICMLLTPYVSRHGKYPRALFGSQTECSLDWYLISQCWDEKLGVRLCMNGPRGRMVVPDRGREEAQLEWTGNCKVCLRDTLPVRRMWPMGMSPSAVSTYEPGNQWNLQSH